MLAVCFQYQSVSHAVCALSMTQEGEPELRTTPVAGHSLTGAILPFGICG